MYLYNLSFLTECSWMQKAFKNYYPYVVWTVCYILFICRQLSETFLNFQQVVLESRRRPLGLMVTDTQTIFVWTDESWNYLSFKIELKLWCSMLGYWLSRPLSIWSNRVILHTDAQMVSSTITNMYFEILTYVLWFFM